MTILFIALINGIIIVAVAYYFLVRNRGSVFERAIALAEKGSFTDARGLIRSKIDHNPNDYKAHFHMAKVYSLESDDENEIKHLKEIKRINRYPPEMSSVTILNRLGEIYYRQENYRASFESFQDSFNLVSENEEALVYLAFMAIGRAEFEHAERFFQKLIQIAPNTSEYRLARGVGLAMMKSDDSLAELEVGLALNPRDVTAKFLASLQAFKKNEAEKARKHIDELFVDLNDINILHMANRLAVGIYYLTKEYDKALECAESCLANAISENWTLEEYDARLAIAYFSMITNDLEKANDNLLELEIRNPADELVLRVSDFRMDLEENVTTIERVSPRGFDFFTHLQDWVRNRFPDEAIYNLSGLKMEEEFDIQSLLRVGESGYRTALGKTGPDPDELIEQFNELRGNSFQSACENIIVQLGFSMEKMLPYRDKDGADFIAGDQSSRKEKALVRIRQWSNQPISDIFLRDMQNNMNELNVSRGFVVAGAKLTPGAEAALNNLKKITVVNEYAFGDILFKVLQ